MTIREVMFEHKQHSNAKVALEEIQRCAMLLHSFSSLTEDGANAGDFVVGKSF